MSPSVGNALQHGRLIKKARQWCSIIFIIRHVGARCNLELGQLCILYLIYSQNRERGAVTTILRGEKKSWFTVLLCTKDSLNVLDDGGLTRLFQYLTIFLSSLRAISCLFLTSKNVHSTLVISWWLVQIYLNSLLLLKSNYELHFYFELSVFIIIDFSCIS